MPMLRLLIFAATFLSLLAPPAFSADSADQAYVKAREAYRALLDSSRRQMYREQWLRVLEGFDAVSEGYPSSARAADAMYMAGKTVAGLYSVSRIGPDAERAVELYLRMATSHPDSSLADDALLAAGALLEGPLDSGERAYGVYRRLVDEHPGGDMAGKARQRLKELARYAPPEPPPPPVQKQVQKPAPAPGGMVVKGPAAGAQGGGSLTAVRHWSNPGYTRVVLDVSSETRFSAHFLAQEPDKGIPPRLYVDIEKTSLDSGLREPTVVGDGLLRQIRTGMPQEDTVRVVLDLGSIGDYKVFPLNDPWRIVIDISGDKGTPELKRNEVGISALPDTGRDAIAKVLDEQPKEAPPLHIPNVPTSSTLRRIVVDAGHGGKDPGAIGPSGVMEKDVTLGLARELAAELARQIGCEVVLTRNGDVYLPLEERTAIANKVGADLFVSLHANANTNRSAYGIETYYLNFSKNDKAAAVVARENGTSLKQVTDLELILFDLMANAKINESSRLATVIQEHLVQGIGGKYSDVRDLGVRQGPFYVLLGATMPSVLVETAFISNPREEQRLASDAYRKSAASAIADAIRIYAVNNKLIAAR